MPEIGARLREARVGAGIEIAELEEATKIRGKYLRALEKEDWEILPGPAYTRSFIRSYAAAVGLDPLPLVEQFRIEREGLPDYDVPRAVDRRPPRQSRSNGERGPWFERVPRGVLLAGILLVLVVTLWILGTSGQ